MTLELGREQAWLLKQEASVLIELGVGGEEFPRNKVKNEFLLDFHLPVESLTSGKSSWSFKAMKLISTALLTQRRCSEASASKQEERCEPDMVVELSGVSPAQFGDVCGVQSCS